MKLLTANQVDVEIDRDDFECIVDMCGYGIRYWCPRAEVDYEAGTYVVHVEADEIQKDPPHAKVLETFDGEDGTQWSRVQLDHDSLKAAIADVVSGRFAVRSDIRDAVSSGDTGDYDSEVGDVLVQAAIFGELVFG